MLTVGGVVGFYVQSGLNFTQLELKNSFIPGIFESIWIKVKLNKNQSRIIGNIYRPNTYPKASALKFNNYLVDILNQIKADKNLKKS